jgi:Protein of unknown function (DUF1236)
MRRFAGRDVTPRAGLDREGPTAGSEQVKRNLSGEKSFVHSGGESRRRISMRISRLAVIAAAVAVPSLAFAALAPIAPWRLPPVPNVVYSGRIAVGATIPRNGSVPTYFIPNYSRLYAFTVLDGHEVIVNRHTARIVRILS